MLKRIVECLSACLILCLFMSSIANAQSRSEKKNLNEDFKFHLSFNLRFDGEYITKDNSNEDRDQKSGFSGQYFGLMMNGWITEKFSYDFRYRLHKKHDGASEYFNTVDKALLEYHIDDNYSLVAGKQTLWIGGYEYDTNPIDAIQWSQFTGNIACYQIGVSGKYVSNNKKHTIIAQICNSPFTDMNDSYDDLYAYNLYWCGDMNWYKTLFSVNLVEYSPDHYINYIALGNKLVFENFDISFDYTNRAASGQVFLFKDYTITSRLNYHINPKWNFFAEFGYDKNDAQEEGTLKTYDTLVLPGSEYSSYYAGVEYSPLITKKNNVVLHAFCASNDSKPETYTFNLGVVWYMHAIDR